MSAVETIEPQTEVQAPIEAIAEQHARGEIFKYAEYVHIGEGAEECPERETGKCAVEGHFHAWLRLPNPFQIRDIAEKARAARARRIRMLKDPDSDAHVILEQELDDLNDENARELMIEEIIERDFTEDYDRAMREVREYDDPTYELKDDDDEIPKLYAHIEQDQEEYARQVRLPEEQRSEDFPTLEKTMGGWSQAIEAELEKIQEPKREALRVRELSQLIGIIRRERIDYQANEAYLHTFNTWQWYVCTYKPRAKGTPNERSFSDIAQFKYEAPTEVVAALQVTFNDLEQRLARSRQAGNS